MKIINNGLEVHDSGTICSTSFEETKFIISEEPKFEVVFQIDMNDAEKSQIRNKLINEHTVAVIFENPKKSYSHATPQMVGHLGGKELYVVFHIEIMGEYQAYILSYTFFLKEVNNG